MMTSEKKQLLDKTFQSFMELGLSGENMDFLDDMVAKDVVGFGTTIDEKIFGVKEMRDLLIRQKEQSAGMEMNWKINTLDIHISTDENTVIYTNDLTLYITVDGNTIEMYMRFSVVLEYVEDKWMVVHWHGSKPEHVESEKDTWGVQTWKEKAEALEKEVAERTADLVEKNKELQVEAALERVRAISLTMQHTSGLQSVIHSVHQELLKLNLPILGGSFIAINSEINDTMHCWGSGGTADTSDEVHIPRFEKPFYTNLLHGIKKGPGFFTESYTREEKIEFFTFLFGHEPWSKLGEKQKEETLSAPGGYTRSCTVSTYTSIFIINHSGEKFSDDDHDILKRFGKVFEQSYTRFLDLQKAEAQAKDAQIEAALERVRSKTMAMHNSNDVGESVATLFDELTALGLLSSFDRCGIGIMQPNKMMELWTAEKGTGKTELTIGHLNMQLHTLLKNVYQKWLDKKETYQYILQGEDKFKYYEAMRKQANYKIRKDYYSSQERIVHTDFFFKEGCLYVFSQNAFTTEATSIFIRFVNVFGQTYRRYLDLQKAEAQAREAQIENALEKVRSRSLAMQSPDELIEVAQLLREEMGALGVEALETSSIYIHDESSGKTQCWFTIKNADNSGKAITDQMTIDLHETWVGQQMYDFYKSAEKQISIRMQGVQRIEWIRYCEEKSDLFGTSHFYGDTIPERTYHLYKFTNGFMGAAAPGEISKESWELLKRATAVFSFAYTRFRDLQMAEASARASLRQASLDRVRADISSMRHADDLSRITPLVFNELTTLGIPFIRCGVFIVHEKSKNVQVYLSTPEGKSLAAMNLPFEANDLTARSVEAWKRGDVYLQHWNQADFVHWGKSLQEQGHVKDIQTYQDAETAPESLHLHFIPFTQGLLYVGSTETLANEQIDLVKALAKSFAIAYARYEDFVKLEAAKAAVESAMVELKSTQAQLVQQEKLASLGQLTAGIAHEIKNPLNFVNNFSEVSLELIDESLEEMNRGAETRDETIVNENLAHIKLNIIKVLDHGTRANSIVNSMLMHSRAGTGRAELNMLNDFIREYSNLAYHGMRAGNHPLDVQMIFDLDESVKEVRLIAEDFSRVVLNICNNAFDAMRTTQKPALTICTLLQKDFVSIYFEDNGPGIPDEIIDKILQPFFTTKKGTEGTGLGLSISHDIVKAHGGALSVETKDGNGSIFIIQIPINTNNG
jgi:signal transduction histidine kinase